MLSTLPAIVFWVLKLIKVNLLTGRKNYLLFFKYNFNPLFLVAEYEAEVEEERQRKEQEARERQDVMTLGNSFNI